MSKRMKEYQHRRAQKAILERTRLLDALIRYSVSRAEYKARMMQERN